MKTQFLSGSSEVWWHTFNSDILKWVDPHLICTTTSVGGPCKEHERSKKIRSTLSSPAFNHCHCQVLFFSDIRVYFWILIYTKDHLRHLILWTKQLLVSWTLCGWAAIIRLAGPQSGSRFHRNSFLYMCIQTDRLVI